jgi:GNAT superfamily N-acetyltransferase
MLFNMVVCDQYQRRGIARRLVASLRDHAAQWGVEILETSVRGGTPAEEVYRRVGFQEYGRLPRGLAEPWGAKQVFDEVYFAMPVMSRGSSARPQREEAPPFPDCMRG